MNTQKFKTFINTAKDTAIKYSPEVLMVTGVVTGVAALVVCAKKSRTIDDKLEDNYIDILEVDRNDKKEVVKVYAKAAGTVIKEYAPVVILEGVSLASFSLSNMILNERNKKLIEQNLSLMAAVTIIEKDFGRYRNNVKKRFGDEIDEELYFGIETEKVTVTEIDPETGKKKKVKKEVKTPTSWSPYAIFLDCSDWYSEKCEGWNAAQIMGIERSINQECQRKGKIFLSDIYDAFEIDDSKLTVEQRRAARTFGYIWNYDDVCDMQIRFFVSDTWNKKAVAAAETGELREDTPWLVDFSNISFIADDYAKGAGTFYNYEVLNREEV